MAYFDGDLHFSNISSRPFQPNTRVYCDDCAETAIPLAGQKGDVGRHWNTGFKWAPYYGAPCHICKRDA